MSDRPHTHKRTPAPDGGKDDGAGFDWFQVLDIAVWVSVFLIAVIGTEWFLGRMVRENISRGASRYLAKAAAEETPA